MSQNRSSAVMQQRTEAHDSLDDFPTPPWATRAIMDLLIPILDKRFGTRWNADWAAREPCANRLHMVKPLRSIFDDVLISDIHDYGYDYPLMDYLFPGAMMRAEATFFNPPFKLAEQFIHRSFDTPSWRMTAALVRTNFLEGEGRYRRLWSKRPPTIVAHFSERVVMVKGRLLDPDVPIWTQRPGRKPKMQKPSTATAYCWIVWIDGVEPLPTRWIPPCRKRLTWSGDYPPLTAREKGPPPKEHGNVESRPSVCGMARQGELGVALPPAHLGSDPDHAPEG